MTVCGIQHADGVCVMGKCPYIKMCCPAVWNKSGKVEMTNEEWFCTLSTGKKAEFLVMIQMSVMHPVKRGAVDMDTFIEDVAEWLKQPHH